VPNASRQRYDFALHPISANQLEALIDIALRKDEPLEKVILEAIDQYIQKEKHDNQSN
jgi:hypothetical protein